MTDIGTAFDIAFKLVLGIEGELTDDKNDTGGLTKYGISKAAFPNVDIANLTVDGAKALYLTNYWQAAKCDKLVWPLSALVFDAAVNQGVQPAIKMLQRICKVAQDGLIGDITIRAANKLQIDDMMLYMAYRAQRYTGTRNFDLYGDGWFKRLFIMAYSVNLTIQQGNNQ